MNKEDALNLDISNTTLMVRSLMFVSPTDEEIMQRQCYVDMTRNSTPTKLNVMCWNDNGNITFAHVSGPNIIIRCSDKNPRKAWKGFIDGFCKKYNLAPILSLNIVTIGRQSPVQKIFVDESGNTGCVVNNKKGDNINFKTQPNFAIGAVLIYDETDEKTMIDRYLRFKDKFEIKGEIKGSDLLIRENNEKLEYFLNNLLDITHFTVNVYNKKFYLATLLMFGLYGSRFQQENLPLFYETSSALSYESDEFFKMYLELISNPNEETLKAYLLYLSQHKYEQLLQVNLISGFANYILQNNLVKENVDDFMTFGWYSDPNVTNLIHLNAISEELIALNEYGRLTRETKIIYDDIEQLDAVLTSEFKEVGINIAFENSKDVEMIQLADNIAGISNSLFSRAIHHFRNGALWKKESEWDLMQMSKFMQNISDSNIKFTVPHSDWAASLCIRDMFSEEYPSEIRNDSHFNDIYKKYLGRIRTAVFEHDFRSMHHLFKHSGTK